MKWVFKMKKGFGFLVLAFEAGDSALFRSFNHGGTENTEKRGVKLFYVLYVTMWFKLFLFPDFDNAPPST